MLSVQSCLKTKIKKIKINKTHRKHNHLGGTNNQNEHVGCALPRVLATSSLPAFTFYMKLLLCFKERFFFFFKCYLIIIVKNYSNYLL